MQIGIGIVIGIAIGGALVAVLMAALGKAGVDKARRLVACGSLVVGLPGVPSPKLAAVRELIGKLRPAFHSERDPDVNGALAAVLGVLHRESHAIYKPDEIAEAHATRVYRERHPEANYAARARQAGQVPAVRFVDVTAASGVRFRHINGAAGKKLLSRLRALHDVAKLSALAAAIPSAETLDEIEALLR